MNSRVQITVDPETLRVARQLVDPKAFRRILISSFNDATRAGKTVISRLVRDEIAVKAKDVNQNVAAVRASGSELDSSNISARVKVNRKPMPMSAYSPRQVGKGVSVRLRKKGKRTQIRAAFIVAKFGNNVFKRVGKERLPLSKKLWGPTVVGVVAGSPGMAGTAADRIADVAESRLVSKVNYHLEGGKVGK